MKRIRRLFYVITYPFSLTHKLLYYCLAHDLFRTVMAALMALTGLSLFIGQGYYRQGAAGIAAALLLLMMAGGILCNIAGIAALLVGSALLALLTPFALINEICRNGFFYEDVPLFFKAGPVKKGMIGKT